ncbi:MAG: Rieske 2Fe-2S domain-containing protein [Solirubrobacteraceae bacterium]
MAGRTAVGSGVGALIRRREPSGLPEAIAAAAATLAPGAGTVVVSREASVALHRGHDGVVTTLDARCPHRGEAVVFNAETCQWDCPRHGATFAADGTLVDGKGLADRPLEPYRLDA